MASRLFDHIDLRVSNVAAARALYDALLPALGFTVVDRCNGVRCYSLEGAPQTAAFIELNESPGHRGNANRIAFRADTEEEVNRLGEIVRAAGARVVEGPEYCAEYKPGYYAVFFEDDDGNRWEICCRNARVRSRVRIPV